MPEQTGSLARANAGVAIGTAASRVTGLARIIVFAAIVGQTSLADAFEIGNNAPNVIYELLIGGALAATLVPTFTKLRRERDTQAIGAVCGAIGLLTIVITALAVACAPLIVRAFTVDVATGVDIERFRSVATAMTRVFVLQIAFYAATAVGSAVLNAAGRFLAAAWAPVAANLVTIVGFALLGAGNDVRPLPLDVAAPGSGEFAWLVGSTTVGITTMASIVIVAAARADALPLPNLRLNHPAVRNILRLSFWSVAYIATNQAALLVVKNLASPGTGNLDAYVKAFTVFQLPHGLLAVSLAVTFVPLLSRAAQDGDVADFSRRLLSGLRMTLFLTLPAGLGLAVMARPLVGTLLEHGAFDADSADVTARTLTAFGVGLGAFSAYLFALRGFYSHGDTRTPFIVNVAQNVVNVVLAVLLVDRLGVTGLAFAFSGSYAIGALIAVTAVAKRHANWTTASMLRGLAPMVAAAGTMAGASWLASNVVLGSNSVTTIAVSRTLIGIVVGVSTYAGLARIFRIAEMTSLLGLLTRDSRGRRDESPRG